MATIRECNTKLLLQKVILGAPLEKHFEELALETLKSRRLFGRLYCMNKIINSRTPDYLSISIPNGKHAANI